NGGFTSTPSSNYFVSDLSLHDALPILTTSAVATVSLTVTNVIRPPVANNDSYGVNKNGSLTVSGPGVLGNDVDLDGNPMSAVLVARTSTRTMSRHNHSWFAYSPASNYF